MVIDMDIIGVSVMVSVMVMVVVMVMVMVVVVVRVIVKVMVMVQVSDVNLTPAAGGGQGNPFSGYPGAIRDPHPAMERFKPHMVPRVYFIHSNDYTGSPLHRI